VSIDCAAAARTTVFQVALSVLVVPLTLVTVACSAVVGIDVGICAPRRDRFDEVRVGRTLVAIQPSGPAVKGSPVGSSEASCEAAPLTAQRAEATNGRAEFLRRAGLDRRETLRSMHERLSRDHPRSVRGVARTLPDLSLGAGDAGTPLVRLGR
jgi:hypothetical protein